MIQIEKNLDKFKTLFKIVGNLAPETNITFKKDGLTIKVIHPSNTCLITLTLNNTLFEKYEIEEEKTYLVDIEKFVSILHIVGNKKISIDIIEKGLVMKQGRKKFVLSHFAGEEEVRSRPDIRATSKWKINSADFFDIINSYSNFSDTCILEAKENLTIYSKSNLVDGEIIVEAEKIESEDSITSYDIGLMSKITDIKQVFPEIRIGFGNVMPIIMRGTTDDIDFEFMLAGRVESE